jgi:hypothetical protein
MTFFRQCSPGRLLEVKQGTLQLTISLWTVDSPSVLHPDGMLVQDVYAFRRSIFRFQAIERSETGQSPEENYNEVTSSAHIQIYMGVERTYRQTTYIRSIIERPKRSHQPSLAVSMS